MTAETRITPEAVDPLIIDHMDCIMIYCTSLLCMIPYGSLGATNLWWDGGTKGK